MKEIGKERLRAAMQDCEMPSRPLSMEGFYIEYRPEINDFFLLFMYPSGVVFEWMSVLGYWRIPDKGWETKRLEI